MSQDKHLRAAGTSIVSNILIQILSRGFTFILGAVTLKYLQSSALLGIINVRLALLYSTLQFLSREPFRRACIGRASKSTQNSWPKIVNTIWLGPIFAIILSIPLIYIWQLNCPSKEDLLGTNFDDYHRAVWVICLVVLIEMLAEPCFIFAQAKAISDHNPRVEILFVTIKCFTSAAVTISEKSQYRSGESSQILTKIACCQLFAALVSIIYSFIRLSRIQQVSPKTFLPSKLSHSSIKTSGTGQRSNILVDNLDLECLQLSSSFVTQTFLKQALTEAERYVMTFFNVISLSEQGIYDVVNNLGSITARLVFKPIEESSYTLFSQTVARDETLDIRRFYKVQENLMLFIKSMLLIGLLVFTFGYNFVPLIVLYGGDKLNNKVAFQLMRWQLFYTPLLAINGVTESFTFALMSRPDFRYYNVILVLSSIMFLAMIYITRPILGSASFILSNCLAMISRIAASYGFIKRYFNKHGYEPYFSDVIPSLTTAISLIGVFIFLSFNQNYLLDLSQPTLVILSMIVGVWSLLFIILVIVRHEDDLMNFGSMLFARFGSAKIKEN